MEGKPGLLLAIFLVAISVAACDRGPKQPDLSLLGPSSAATSTVLPFGSPQCTEGGIRIDAGIDANGNGVLDVQEVAKASPICNDLDNKTKKPNGYSSLVKIASEPTGTLHCPAGGLKILSGTDANKNSVLDANEIVYAEYVCNGAPGSSSEAGIMVAVGPPVVPCPNEKKKKKSAKSSLSQTTQAPSDEPGKTPKKVDDKMKSSSLNAAKGASTTSVVLKGWNNVKVQSPQLARVAYKIDGRYIVVRFTNLSETSPVRFKYTVRWKEGQNGSWVDESTMEGIGFRLKPLEKLDREVLTHAQEVKDVVIEIDVSETTLGTLRGWRENVMLAGIVKN